MDARFHELAEAVQPGQGRKECRPGSAAWVILFLSIFSALYGGLMLMLEMCIGQYHEVVVKLSSSSIMLGLFAGWPAIAYYRIRSLLPVRCVAFAASASAILLAADPLWEIFQLAADDSFFIGSLYGMGLLIPVLHAEMSAVRAKYAYSEKTGQWLQCHISKKRVVLEPGQRLPGTAEEFLKLKAGRTTWRDKRFSILMPQLFLDSEPDGEHYLWCAERPQGKKFFTFKFSQPEFIPVIIPLDWEHAEMLRAHFGPFKKTRFIPMTSARLGSWVRERKRSFPDA